MQQIKLKNIGWDERLLPELEKQWTLLSNDLLEILKTEIPRFIATCDSLKSARLHIFADASKHAYTSCVYLETFRNDQVEIHLLFSKTRTPKLSLELTIPQLELLAALIASKVIHFVATALNFPERSVSFNPSKIVSFELSVTHDSTIAN